MFEVIYRFTDIRENIKNVQCDVFDTIEAAREFILEQFDSLVEDTTDGNWRVWSRKMAGTKTLSSTSMRFVR